ncbi:MAG TPA: hypothetical protein VIH14_02755, partial [Anaerolineales bacterium]
MKKFQRLLRLSVLFSILLAACGLAEPQANPVQTAMSLTLAARPPASVTPLVTETLDLSAPP